jgi:hypothetical protein
MEADENTSKKMKCSKTNRGGLLQDTICTIGYHVHTRGSVQSAWDCCKIAANNAADFETVVQKSA